MISTLIQSCRESRLRKSAYKDDPDGDEHESRPLYIPGEVSDVVGLFPRLCHVP